MAWIVDYAVALKRMEAGGFRCVYHNSGAFEAVNAADIQHRGWLAAADSTIRPALQLVTRIMTPPDGMTPEQHLADRAIAVWWELPFEKVAGQSPSGLRGPLWVMPKSHWSYELQFGSKDWLPAVLEHAGIDPGHLLNRTNAAVLEFSMDESQTANYLVSSLLRMLLGSDFCLAWPGLRVLCTIHHHKQLWWSGGPDAIAIIDRVASL